MRTASLKAPARKEAAPLKLREKAYASFTDHLLARVIKPGQFISQRELVDLTGLPLGAIRELIPRLEAEGLIKVVSQRGMQIVHVDLSMIRDAFQFRIILEREAVAIFTKEASDGLLARLRKEHADIITICKNARTNGSLTADLIAQAQMVDWGLHSTIIDSLGNEIISNNYHVNSIKIRLIRQEQTRLNDVLVIPTMEEHMTVIEAIESRDPVKAVTLLETHIMFAQNRALGIR